ncbi:MAG: NAD(P)/FAD-dependent oxidoreductase [Flavobacteriales bacterium]|nr:NAD(P)/FAD-dependent oxidoreductase [Flavobacteriales bacterium]
MASRSGASSWWPGRGGFNLTNELEGDDLLRLYAPAGLLDEALRAFGPAQLRGMAVGLGVETFIGTSGRVFPKKASSRSTC